jgi:hypothetical protein
MVRAAAARSHARARARPRVVAGRGRLLEGAGRPWCVERDGVPCGGGGNGPYFTIENGY